MKENEARPLLRMLASVIALIAWFGVVHIVGDAFQGGIKKEDWMILPAALIGAIAFSYIAIAGYLPRALLQFFSFDPVEEHEDMK